MLSEHCDLTHRQIIGGVCPWCEQLIDRGKDIVNVPTKGPVWDLDSLLRGLDDDNDNNRLTTINNVLFSTSCFNEFYASFYEKALTNDNYYVRWHMTIGLVNVGLTLTLPEALKVEKLLAIYPMHLCLRILLLCYHCRHRNYYQLSEQRHGENLLWIVRNRPDCPIFSLTFITYIDSLSNKELYQTAKHFWLNHLRLYNQEPLIVNHAAQFFSLYDPTLSESLLKTGQAIDLENPTWSIALGRLYQSKDVSSPEKQRLLQNAIVEYRNALRYVESNLERASLLLDIAVSALACDDIIIAKASAIDALRLELPTSMESFRSDLVHRGNNILGRIAIIEGDIQKAKEYLRISVTSFVASPASPLPCVRLAYALLQNGQRNTVVDYFQRCLTLWCTTNHQIEYWIHEIVDGRIPDFELEE